jgi:hypothetical protein
MAPRRDRSVTVRDDSPDTLEPPANAVNPSLYPPQYIWDSLSQSQRDGCLAGIVASLQVPEPRRKRSRVDLTEEDDNVDDDDGKVPPAVVPILPNSPA